MFRTLALGVLGLALALPAAPHSAQTSPRPASELLAGRAHGAWDLPGEREAGFARGFLLDLGTRRLALEAKLLDAPVRGDLETGALVGVLRTLDAAGAPGKPVAEVLGRYVAGPDGRGRFEATITPLSPRIQRVGRIEGLFADPVVDGKDTVGRFVGRWVLR